MNKKKFILLALLLLCAYFYELFGGVITLIEASAPSFLTIALQGGRLSNGASSSEVSAFKKLRICNIINITRTAKETAYEQEKIYSARITAALRLFL